MFRYLKIKSLHCNPHASERILDSRYSTTPRLEGAVMVNRRMFRPGFPDVKEPSIPRPQHNGPIPSKKPAPPETTHAENFYWVKQMQRSEEHTSELQSQSNLVCRLLLEKKKHREH